MLKETQFYKIIYHCQFCDIASLQRTFIHQSDHRQTYFFRSHARCSQTDSSVPEKHVRVVSATGSHMIGKPCVVTAFSHVCLNKFSCFIVLVQDVWSQKSLLEMFSVSCSLRCGD